MTFPGLAAPQVELWASYVLGNWLVQSSLMLGMGLVVASLPRIGAGTRHTLALATLVLAALSPLTLTLRHPVAARVDPPKVVGSLIPSAARTVRQPASGPASAPQAPVVPNFATLMALGWAAGCTIRLLWLFGGSMQVAAWLRRSRRVDARHLFDSVGYEIADLEVRSTTDLARPAVAGVIRPAILLPSALLERADESLRPVLLHEGAHYRRRDPMRLLLAEAAAAVLFWHPLAWVMRRQLDRLAEEACDREVLAKGITPGDYARTLLELLAPPTGPRSPLTCSLGRAGRELQRRIEALFHLQRQPSGLAGVFAAVGLIPALAGAVSIEMGVRPQVPQPAPKPSPIQAGTARRIKGPDTARGAVKLKPVTTPVATRAVAVRTVLPAPVGVLRMARLEPSLALSQAGEPVSGRVVVFLLDISSSMRPHQEAARRDLLDRVAALHAGDSFNVVAFATEQHRFAPEPVAADELTRTGVESWLTTLPEASGTCPLPALELALSTPGAGSVVLISDTQTATGALAEQVESLVRDRNTSHATVLAVTLGEAAASGVTGVPAPMGIVERVVAAEEAAAPL